MFRVRDFWGAVGVVFFLIALYLLLANATGANSLFATLFKGGTEFAGKLQGR